MDARSGVPHDRHSPGSFYIHTLPARKALAKRMAVYPRSIYTLGMLSILHVSGHTKPRMFMIKIAVMVIVPAIFAALVVSFPYIFVASIVATIMLVMLGAAIWLFTLTWDAKYKPTEAQISIAMGILLVLFVIVYSIYGSQVR